MLRDRTTQFRDSQGALLLVVYVSLYVIVFLIFLLIYVYFSAKLSHIPYTMLTMQMLEILLGVVQVLVLY